jgi:hypothetical protein
VRLAPGSTSDRFYPDPEQGHLISLQTTSLCILKVREPLAFAIEIEVLLLQFREQMKGLLFFWMQKEQAEFARLAVWRLDSYQLELFSIFLTNYKWNKPSQSQL